MASRQDVPKAWSEFVSALPTESRMTPQRLLAWFNTHPDSWATLSRTLNLSLDTNMEDLLASFADLSIDGSLAFTALPWEQTEASITPAVVDESLTEPHHPRGQVSAGFVTGPASSTQSQSAVVIDLTMDLPVEMVMTTEKGIGSPSRVDARAMSNTPPDTRHPDHHGMLTRSKMLEQIPVSSPPVLSLSERYLAQRQQRIAAKKLKKANLTPAELLAKKELQQGRRFRKRIARNFTGLSQGSKVVIFPNERPLGKNYVLDVILKMQMKISRANNALTRQRGQKWQELCANRWSGWTQCGSMLHDLIRDMEQALSRNASERELQGILAWHPNKRVEVVDLTATRY